jgi:hypothetical protein
LGPEAQAQSQEQPQVDTSLPNDSNQWQPWSPDDPTQSPIDTTQSPVDPTSPQAQLPNLGA